MAPTLSRALRYQGRRFLHNFNSNCNCLTFPNTGQPNKKKKYLNICLVKGKKEEMFMCLTAFSGNAVCLALLPLHISSPPRPPIPTARDPENIPIHSKSKLPPLTLKPNFSQHHMLLQSYSFDRPQLNER